MKKLLSILLTLALCVGLMPAMTVPVHAASYDLWVGGVQVTDENASDLTAAINAAAGSNVASGSASYSNGTLILDNFSYSGSGYNYNPNYFAAIYTVNTSISISVNGTNSIILHKANSGVNEYAYGLFANDVYNVNINGSGSLLLKADKVDNKYNCYGMRLGEDATLTIDGAFLRSIGDEGASNNSRGIYMYEGGQVKVINGGELECFGGNSAIYANLDQTNLQYGSSYSVLVGSLADGSDAASTTETDLYNLRSNKYLHVSPPVISYNLYVAGVQVASDNLVIDSTDNAAITSGSATYAPATKTLTLNNFAFEGTGYKEPDYHYYSAIYKYYDSDPLTIELIGTNSLSETGAAAHTNETYNNSYGIHTDCDVTFTGSGTLTAKGGKASQLSEGLYINGVLKVPSSFTGTVTGKVDDAAGSTCACYGICANVATIESGTINAFGPSDIYGDSYGLRVDAMGTGLTISGGTITATGKTKAVILPSKNYHITGNAEASTSIDGSNPVLFDINQMGTYLWFHYPSSITPVTPYDLYVGGVQVNSANKDNVLGDTGTPTVVYDPTTATLYLKDASINTFLNHGSNDSSAIYTKSNLTINVTGNNAISVVNAPEDNDIHGIDLDEEGLSLRIEGDGSLDILCGASGFHSATCIDLWPYSGIRNKVTICDSVKVKAEQVKGNSTFGAISVTGDIVLCDNAQLTVIGGDSNRGSLALRSSFSVLVKDNAVLIAIGGSNAPESGSESMSSIAVESSDMTVQDNAVVAATGGTVKASDDAQSIGIQVNPNKLIINGGTVAANTKATQGKAQALNSAPVLASGMVAGGSVNSDGSGAVEYAAADNDIYKWFKTPFTVVPKADTPVFAPSATSFTETIDVTITCALNGATVYYTDDGSDPSATNGTVTTGAAITLTETKTLKAIAVMAGYDDSDIATATYTKNDPSPTPSSGGGSTPAPETYAVTPGSAENGKITVSPKDAAEGDKVTVTVTPDEGYELDTLTVKDKDGNEIKVIEKDGVYTFMMPASEVDIEATFKEAEEEPAPSDDFPFVDVPEDAYYRKPVEWAVEKGITSGVSKDEYGPELSCTRAQVVTFLWITCGSPDAGTATGFDDVDVEAYYDQAVAWAVEQGITAGTSEGEFSPDMTITRAQFVTMLWVANGKPEVDGEMPFKDVPGDSYYAKAVAWAYANDITAGKSADSFGPEDPCTRGQIMTLLYNAYGE